MKYAASLAALLLVGMAMSSHDVNPIAQVAIWAWIISAWEWLYRPLFLDLKHRIERKFQK